MTCHNSVLIGCLTFACLMHVPQGSVYLLFTEEDTKVRAIIKTCYEVRLKGSGLFYKVNQVEERA